jgi:hypothetical protein
MMIRRSRAALFAATILSLPVAFSPVFVTPAAAQWVAQFLQTFPIHVLSAPIKYLTASMERALAAPIVLGGGGDSSAQRRTKPFEGGMKRASRRQVEAACGTPFAIDRLQRGLALKPAEPAHRPGLRQCGVGPCDQRPVPQARILFDKRHKAPAPGRVLTSSERFRFESDDLASKLSYILTLSISPIAQASAAACSFAIRYITLGKERFN